LTSVVCNITFGMSSYPNHPIKKTTP